MRLGWRRKLRGYRAFPGPGIGNGVWCESSQRLDIACQMAKMVLATVAGKDAFIRDQKAQQN